MKNETHGLVVSNFQMNVLVVVLTLTGVNPLRTRYEEFHSKSAFITIAKSRKYRNYSVHFRKEMSSGGIFIVRQRKRKTKVG